MGQIDRERLAAEVAAIRLSLDGIQAAARLREPQRSKNSLAELAERLLEERRLRSDFLSSKLFGEPAWDILLVLYAAHARREQLATGAVAKAARVNLTTGLRVLDVLEAQALVSRSRVGRRTMLVLTPVGLDRMSRLLETF